MGEPEEPDNPDESAAGPEARAAAEQAMEAYDRARGHSPRDLLGGRTMDDVVEAMMQQAFPSDHLQVGPPAVLWLDSFVQGEAVVLDADLMVRP